MQPRGKVFAAAIAIESLSGGAVGFDCCLYNLLKDTLADQESGESEIDTFGFPRP